MAEFIGKLGLNIYLTDDCICMIVDDEEPKVAVTVFSCFYFDISLALDLYYI